MTDKIEQAIENATAKRKVAKEHWERVSGLSQDIQTQLSAAEAEWLAWDALLIAAQAKKAGHPLVDVIAYYGGLANEHARSATRCVGVGFPDGAQDALIAAKKAHRNVREHANILAESVKIIDRIACYQTEWAEAVSLDFPDIYYSGRQMHDTAINHVRKLIKKHLDSKEEASE